MKISKLYSKGTRSVSKTLKTNTSTSNSTIIRHKFYVLSADEINNNRSSKYQYI